MVMVRVNGVKLKMEADSAAAMSIISQRMYNKRFKKLKLRPSKVMLRDYSGKSIQVLGEMDVRVKCGTKS
uniref:Aspartic peptidase DDI1-type domain-containing protein n=1 Tax=Anguilla anguilla TaxID=7936 RepID=A0A0E9PRJ7_ANGAN